MKKHCRFFIFFVLFVSLALSGCAGLMNREPVVERNPDLPKETLEELQSCCRRYPEARNSSIWIKQKSEPDDSHKDSHKVYVIYGRSGDTDKDTQFGEDARDFLEKQGFSVKGSFNPREDGIFPERASVGETLRIKNELTGVGFFATLPKDYKP